MKDHELKVKHVDTGKEYVISKSHYLNNPKEWEVLDGEAPEVKDPASFEAPKAPGKPKVTDNPKVKGDEKKKQDEGADANKMDKGAETNKSANKPTPPPAK